MLDEKNQIDDATFMTARARFDAYAGMDGPKLPNDERSALQVRLGRWQTREFGPVSTERCALGVGEEVGELAEAYDAALSGVIVSGEYRSRALDAVADICIYATNLCTGLRLDFWALNHVGFEMDMARVVVRSAAAAGRLQHAVLKSAQGIRGMHDPEKYRRAAASAVHGLVREMSSACYMFGADLETVVTEVAEEVMKRTWKKWPETGGAA